MNKFLKIFIFFSLSLSIKLQALEVTLTEGSIKPTPIAVTDFFSEDKKNLKLGKNVTNVISDNLERSGLFLPIDPKTFFQSIESLSNQPRFEDWKAIKAQHLISGKISKKKSKYNIS